MFQFLKRVSLKTLTALALLSGFSVSLHAQVIPPDGTVDGTPLAGDIKLWLDGNDIDGDGVIDTDIAALVTAGVLRYDAVGDNYYVVTWKDKSGNALPAGDYDVTQATAANQPLYLGNSPIFNGNSVLDFDNTDDLTKDITNWSGPYTIFLAVTSDSPSPTNFESFFSNDDNSFNQGSMQIFFEAGLFKYLAGNAPQIKIDFEPFVPNELKLFTVDHNGTTTANTYSDNTLANSDGAMGSKGNEFMHYRINVNRVGNFRHDSKIAEVLIYDRVLTACERAQVSYYLGEKYGRDYIDVASNYGFGGTHANAINGIGLINLGCTNSTTLDEAVSDAIKLSNASSNDVVDEYITLGHDAAGYALMNTDVPTGVTDRITQTWKIDEDGDLGTVDVSFDLSFLLGSYSNYKLLVDTDGDGDFSNATVYAASGVVDGKVQFAGVSLDNNQLVSLGIGPVPGGISSALNLWLKADEGVTETSGAVSEWADQSGTGNNVSQATPADQPTFNASLNNFNPSVEFTDHFLQDSDGVVPDGTNNIDHASVYMVFHDAVRTGSDWIFREKTNGGNRFSFSTFNANYQVDIPQSANGRIQLPKVDFPERASLLSYKGGSNGIHNAGDADKQAVFVNGALKVSDTNSSIFGGNATDIFYLGDHVDAIDSPNTPLEGDISEVILYFGPQSLDDQRKIESYLALKYGITLDQTAELSYLASDGTPMWDATGTSTSGYNNDIFGIGRDDASSLDQRISTSQETDDILTVALDNNFTASNTDLATRTTAVTNDLSFLVFANNNTPVAFNAGNTEFSAGYTGRIDREWQVQATNFSQAVSLKFDGFGTDYVVVKSTTGDFATNATSLGRLDANGELANVTLADGEFITLMQTVAPGGIGGALNLWLKADAGTSTTTNGDLVSTWNDQSGAGVNASQGLAVLQPTFIANQINFNPVVDFDGADDEMSFAANSIALGNDNYSFRFVAIAEAVNLNSLISSGAEITNGMTLLNISGTNGNLGDIWNTNNVFSANGSVPIGGLAWVGGSDYDNTRGRDLYVNNNNVVSNTNTVTNTPTGLVFLGKRTGAFPRLFNGKMAEVIAYTNSNSGSDLLQIDSYLALKYGVTLDQTTATNYVASDGTTYWDATPAGTYNNDIFGIGRDDASSLDQRISTSQETDDILTVALDANFIAANTDFATRTTAVTNDLSFLTFANNNTPVAFNVGNTEFTADYVGRIDREWQVQATNFSQAVNLKFDGFGADYVVVKSTNATGDFSADATTLGRLDANGELADITLADGEYITLMQTVAPGGISTSLNLWLKADAGTYTDASGNTVGTTAATDGDVLLSWDDISGGRVNDAVSRSGVQNFRNNSADNINFNPVVDFDGLGGLDYFDDYIFTLAANGGNTSFSVVKPDDAASTKLRQFVFDFGYFEDEGYGFIYGDEHWGMYTSILHSGASDFDNTHTFGRATSLLTYDINFGSNQVFRHNGTDLITQAITLSKLEANEINERSTPGPLNTDGGPVSIGRQAKDNVFGSNGTRAFDGSIGEIIQYTSDLSATDRQKVESYLALKYGVWMAAGASDYLASTGTMWSTSAATAGYNNDIFGIGRDDASSLDQRISTSQETDDILTVALDNNFIAANTDLGTRTTALANDLSFLVFANNNTPVAFNAGNTEFTADYVGRIDREWQVQATNFSQAVNLKFDGFGADYVVVKSTTGDFATNATTLGRLDANGELADVTLADGEFITLMQTVAPGGIGGALNLWLKADEGTYTDASGNTVGTTAATDGDVLLSWDDISGGRTNDAVSRSGVQNFRNNSADNINFNPVVDFDGAGGLDYFDDYIFTPAAAGGNTTFSVVQPDAAASTKISQFIFDFGRSADFAYNIMYGNTRLVLSTPTDVSAGGAVLLANPHGRGTRTTLLTADINFGGDQSVRFDGVNLSSVAIPGLVELSTNEIIENPTYDDGGPVTIGRQSKFNAFGTSPDERAYDGSIGEIIQYTTDLSATDRQKVESYLALKYGIWMAAGASDYLASTGSMWSTAAASAGYIHDIFGIGRDDVSGLDQRISTSQEADDILTVSLDNNFIAANTDLGTRTTALTNDLSFLTFANNNGAASTWSVADKPCICSGAERIPRVWEVQETGTVGSVWVAVNATGLSAPSDTENVYLLVDNDGDGNMSTAQNLEYYEMVFDDLGDADPSNDVYKVQIDFVDGEIFTIARYKRLPRMRHGKKYLFDRELLPYRK